MSTGHFGTGLVAEILSTRRKTCISATLPGTNPTWTGLGFDPGLYSEMVKSKHISHSVDDPAHRLQMDDNFIFHFSVSLQHTEQLISLI
jgi:hypothetical protein